MLTPKDIQTFADELGLDYCTVKAVISVEAQGEPFLADGKPKILFEGHILWRQLVKLGLDPMQYVEGNENVLYKNWTKKHYIGGAGEYRRLNQAMLIHKEAAYMSASWGLFQIMGFNYASCDVATIQEFVVQQDYIEGQLKLAAAFIRNAGHIPALKRRDWATFARRYNGPEYAQNSYDTRLQKAYDECSRSM